MHTLKLAPLMIGLVASSAITLSGARAEQPARRTPQCFRAGDWSGWKATPDAKSMYIRVSGRRLYRLDFSGACHAARGIGVHLVTRIRGSSSICSPLDLDLKVADSHGFATPCIVNRITPLSSEEAAALPRSLQP